MLSFHPPGLCQSLLTAAHVPDRGMEAMVVAMEGRLRMRQAAMARQAAPQATTAKPAMAASLALEQVAEVVAGATARWANVHPLLQCFSRARVSWLCLATSWPKHVSHRHPWQP